MKIVVLGGGQMGTAIAHDLLAQADVKHVVLADNDKKTLQTLRKRLPGKRLQLHALDVTQPRNLQRLIAGAQCVVGATSYAHNALFTAACIDAGVHFCDLGGNPGVVRKQHALDRKAQKQEVCIIPDCGLAPGLVNIVGYHLAQSFDAVDQLNLRVGGLPQLPENALGYQRVFSVQGLINEYLEPSEVLVRGKRQEVRSLDGLETLSMGKRYPALEAFYTAGGTSSLPETLAGKVQNLDYKTLRYPGHAAVMRALLDMGMAGSKAWKVDGTPVVPRAVLTHALEAYLPHAGADVVLIRVTLSGRKQGHSIQEVHDCIDVHDDATDLSAMQRTTGFSIAMVAQMLARGEISARGVVHQELAVPAELFMQGLAARQIRFVSAPPTASRPR